MEKLIAKNPILYKGRQYNAGDELPADDEEMIEAWKRAGTVMEASEDMTAESKREAKKTKSKAESSTTKGENHDV